MNLERLLNIAQEADKIGDYVTADKITNLLKTAQGGAYSVYPNQAAYQRTPQQSQQLKQAPKTNASMPSLPDMQAQMPSMPQMNQQMPYQDCKLHLVAAFVDSSAAFVDSFAAFVDSSEAFVDSSAAFADSSEAFADSSEAFVDFFVVF
jgi:hypothetical protein